MKKMGAPWRLKITLMIGQLTALKCWAGLTGLLPLRNQVVLIRRCEAKGAGAGARLREFRCQPRDPRLIRRGIESARHWQPVCCPSEFGHLGALWNKDRRTRVTTAGIERVDVQTQWGSKQHIVSLEGSQRQSLTAVTGEVKSARSPCCCRSGD